jgi:hypothetical protein
MIKSLSIKKQDGSIIPVEGATPRIKSGVLCSLESSGENNSIRISKDTDNTTDYAVLDKYRKVLEGSGGFSGIPYYISSINKQSGQSGHIKILTDSCLHAGVFDTADVIDDQPNTLSITDVCKVEVDCPEYRTLHEYMDVVRESLEETRDEILKYQPDRRSDILNLYDKTMQYWNHIVHLASWRTHAEARGSEIQCASIFINRFDVPIPSGLKIQAAIPSEFVMHGETVVGAEFILDYSVSGDIPVSITYDVNAVLFTGSDANEATDSMVAKLEAWSGSIVIPSTQGFYIGKYFLIELEAELEIVCVVTGRTSGSISFDIPAWSQDGEGFAAETEYPDVTVKDIKNMGVEIEEELPPGGSVKVYSGTFYPQFVGEHAGLSVTFKNNVAELDVAFEGFPPEREITTNRMFVINMAVF